MAEDMREKSEKAGSLITLIMTCISRARDSKLEGEALLSFCENFLRDARFYKDTEIKGGNDSIIRSLAKRVVAQVTSEKDVSKQDQEFLDSLPKKTSTTKELASATWVHGDGGVTLEVCEKTSTHEEYGRWASLGLRARVSHFGHQMTVELPMLSPDVIAWLQKTLDTAMVGLSVDNQARADGLRISGIGGTSPKVEIGDGVQTDEMAQK